MLRVEFHNGAGQPAACLEGFERYAQSVERSDKAAGFPSERHIRDYLFRQPVKLDRGEGPVAQGCFPAQRSRLWPEDGLNCWEATAHYLGVLLLLDPPLEVHVFDAQLERGRHIFPALRRLDSDDVPEPVLLQPPILGAPAQAVLALAVRAERCERAQGMLATLRTPPPPIPRRAQALTDDWGRNLFGVVHTAGSTVLTTFGLGGLPKLLEGVEEPLLPEWSKRSAGPTSPSSSLTPTTAPGSAQTDAATRREVMALLDRTSQFQTAQGLRRCA